MSETLPLLGRAKHSGGAGCCEGGALVGGGRTIGWFGSIALVVNNISGPGMLEFPAAFQAAGWVPSLAVLVAVWALSSLSASLLSGAMRSMPGNGRFQRRVEFSDVFMHYMGRRWATATHAAFFLCLMAQNVAAIVATAQVVDAAIAAYLPFPTAALQLWPSPEVVVWDGQECGRHHRHRHDDGGIDQCVPFAGNGPLVITAGYLVTAALFAPMGTWNLEENMLAQKLSFVALLALVGEFLLAFATKPDFTAARVPAFGPVWRDIVGVVIFNFAFCVTVPSWLNEKAPKVDADAVIWASTTASTVLYCLVGILGAMAFPSAPEDILSLLLSAASPGLLTRLCAVVFALVIIGLGIPVFCVMMRYNLVNGRVCSPRAGMFWAAYVPWLVSWAVYQGSVALEMLSWSGLVLNGFVDFLCPLLAAMAAAALLRNREGRLGYTLALVLLAGLVGAALYLKCRAALLGLAGGGGVDVAVGADVH